MKIKALNITNFLWAFLFFQIFAILTFLATRNKSSIEFDNYLQVVKYSTLILLIFSLWILFNERISVFKFNLLKYIFVFQMAILYFTMIIHTDIKAINSPTIILMLISSLILFSKKISSNFINLISIVISYINFVIVLLQVLNVIPVAQDNIREGLNLITDRPTGLLFNAFAKIGRASCRERV
jgi:hypothetical protein